LFRFGVIETVSERKPFPIKNIKIPFLFGCSLLIFPQTHRLFSPVEISGGLKPKWSIMTDFSTK
jgi:hypothetical protein